MKRRKFLKIVASLSVVPSAGILNPVAKPTWPDLNEGIVYPTYANASLQYHTHLKWLDREIMRVLALPSLEETLKAKGINVAVLR